MGVATIRRLERPGAVYAFKKVYDPGATANSASDHPLVYIARASRGLVVSGDYYLTEMPGEPCGTFVMEPYQGGPVVRALFENIVSANNRRSEPADVVARKMIWKGRVPRARINIKNAMPPAPRQ